MLDWKRLGLIGLGSRGSAHIGEVKVNRHVMFTPIRLVNNTNTN